MNGQEPNDIEIKVIDDEAAETEIMPPEPMTLRKVSEDVRKTLQGYTQEGTKFLTEEQLQDLHADERAKINELFAGVNYETPIRVFDFHKQEQGHSCVLATSINALGSLGIEGLSEREIAENAATSNGAQRGVRTFYTIHSLESLKSNQGAVKVENLVTTLDAMATMEEDGVVVFVVPAGKMFDNEAHAILISGFRSDQGELTFRIADPLNDGFEDLTLDQLLNYQTYYGPSDIRSFGIKLEKHE